MPTDPLQTLRAAVAGLEFPSEQDAPFTAFRWAGKKWPDARSAVLSDSGYEKGDPQPPVTEEQPAAFFARLERTPDAERFRKLRAALESTVAGLTILRVGEVQVAYYLIGRTPAGEYAGVWTTAVET
ncbi:MAG TPA: nuclease A inhibitor family protein [Humisphaera sp.]